MIPIYVVQQSSLMQYGEHHNHLDQRWTEFLFQCGYLPIVLPNYLLGAELMLAQNLANCGLLTGGGVHKLDAKEPRSMVEQCLLQWSEQHQNRLIGVCRGMQAMVLRSGGKLLPCSGHVTDKQSIQLGSQVINVNSYHNLACEVPHSAFDTIARSADGVPKAILGKCLPWLGIMWHPERLQPFRQGDIDIFQRFFQGGTI